VNKPKPRIAFPVLAAAIHANASGMLQFQRQLNQSLISEMKRVEL
jgi:hypothetical protein